jgi:hypothetical protein
MNAVELDTWREEKDRQRRFPDLDIQREIRDDDGRGEY